MSSIKHKNQPFLVLATIFLLLISIGLIIIGVIFVNQNTVAATKFKISDFEVESQSVGLIVILAGVSVLCFVLFRLLSPQLSTHREPEELPIENQNQIEPTKPPVFPESRAFFSAKGFDEKKDIITPIHEAIYGGGKQLGPMEYQRCTVSQWELDRIIMYIWEGFEKTLKTPDPIIHIKLEFQRVEARGGESSLIPLYYALESYLNVLNAQNLSETPEHKKEFENMDRYLKARWPELDGNNKVKNKLKELIDRK